MRNLLWLQFRKITYQNIISLLFNVFTKGSYIDHTTKHTQGSHPQTKHFDCPYQPIYTLWNRSFWVVWYVGGSVCSCYLKLSCFKSAFKYLLFKFRLPTTKDLFSCISFITLKLHLCICCLNFVGNRIKMGEVSGFF